jgi:hypothetical protein
MRWVCEGAVDIYDDDVQKAIGGADISSKNDFILGVRSNPDGVRLQRLMKWLQHLLIQYLKVGARWAKKLQHNY